jgi:hypothetical protein
MRLTLPKCPKWARMTIWTSKTQVMAKRKVGSQTDTLTPDHGKSGIDPIPLRAGDVRHIVGKFLMKATTLV